MSHGAVQIIKDKESFDAAIKSDKLVVVDFFAEWCGPCKRIAPMFVKWSGEYSDVTFLKVDVDAVADVAQACNIEAMPTFHFYKGGKKIDEVVGADHNKVLELVKKHK